MSAEFNAASGWNAGRASAERDSELLDVRAVAHLLNCSSRHVYRLSDAGKMPSPRHIGALVRWSRTEIMNWIADGCPAVRRVKGA